MPYSLLPTLLLQILVIGYTPGPANIYSLAMSLRHGRRESLRMWLGLLTGFSIAACIMAILTHLLGIAIGEYVSYLKYAGAAYLVYLAHKICKRNGQMSGRDSECSFWGGMIVQLTNAKMLLFELTGMYELDSLWLCPGAHDNVARGARSCAPRHATMWPGATSRLTRVKKSNDSSETIE